MKRWLKFKKSNYDKRFLTVVATCCGCGRESILASGLSAPGKLTDEQAQSAIRNLGWQGGRNPICWECAGETQRSLLCKRLIRERFNSGEWANRIEPYIAHMEKKRGVKVWNEFEHGLAAVSAFRAHCQQFEDWDKRKAAA